MKLYVPIRTVSEANAHEHWRARQKRAKAQRGAIAILFSGTHVRPERERLRAELAYATVGLVVTITRIAPRALDSDNLAGSSKHLRDQVADELGLPNDRDPRVEWRYEQHRGRQGEYAVEITIEPRSGKEAA